MGISSRIAGRSICFVVHCTTSTSQPSFWRICLPRGHLRAQPSKTRNPVLTPSSSTKSGGLNCRCQRQSKWDRNGSTTSSNTRGTLWRNSRRLGSFLGSKAQHPSTSFSAFFHEGTRKHPVPFSIAK